MWVKVGGEVENMLKKTLVLAFVAGGLVALSGGGEASAACMTASGMLCDNTTQTLIEGSKEFGFDPTNLLAAVDPRNADGTRDTTAATCFTCVNQFSNTAGALTNSMFGVLRPNSNADLGDQARTPDDQGQTDIPSQSVNNGQGGNDLGAFTFSLPLPQQNFLSAGDVVVASTLPADAPLVRPAPEGGSFGKAGVALGFSNTFVFHENGTSAFEQSMEQTTFVGGIKGNEFQTVQFDASVGSLTDETDPENNSVAESASADVGGTLRWAQTIQEDSFVLGRTDGSFRYEGGSLDQGALAIGPSGQEQSNGTTP